MKRALILLAVFITRNQASLTKRESDREHDEHSQRISINVGRRIWGFAPGLGCGFSVIRKGTVRVPVSLNFLALVRIPFPAGRTLPDVANADCRLSFGEIMDDRMTFIAAATSDNHVPLSG